MAPKHHPQAKPQRPAHKRLTSPNAHKPKSKAKPRKPAPSGPAIPPGQVKPDHSNAGKGPPAVR
jgi:nucleoid-associated protein YgaU